MHGTGARNWGVGSMDIVAQDKVEKTEPRWRLRHHALLLNLERPHHASFFVFKNMAVVHVEPCVDHRIEAANKAH